MIKENSDLNQLGSVARKLASMAKIGDVFLLQGELGAGKTTFARFFIDSLFKKNLLTKPKSIRSPSFPIMINYSLGIFEVFHYDFYRIKNKKEILELNFYESITENVTLVEWPEIIVKDKKLENYFLISLKIISSNKREIVVAHSYIKDFYYGI